MSPSYRTIAAAVRFEPERILGSRHIASAYPLAAETEVPAILQQVRAELRPAGHHAHAWRLGRDGARFRSSDDGEPSGTAGRPILQQIDRLQLTRVLVVVSRIFGGTRLGTGGLVRAYGGAAAAVLERVDIVERVVTATLEIEHDYGDAGVLQGLLHAHGLQPVDAAYGARTRLVLEVAVDRAAAFAASVRDATADRAQVSITPPAEEP